MSLPDFLIIGGQKCGTSSLHEYLSRHPNLRPPLQGKERHFFDRKLRNAASHTDRLKVRYARYFPPRSQLAPGTLVYESTPSYLFYPLAAERIASVMPDVRLIMLLRDPVERAISGYGHQKRRGRESLPLMEALLREEERLRPHWQAGDFHHPDIMRYSYKARGRYAEQLSRYLDYFPTEQLLWLDSAELFGKPDVTVKKILSFLQVDSVCALGEFPQRNRGTSTVHAARYERRLLADYFAPHNQELFRVIGEDYSWSSPASNL